MADDARLVLESVKRSLHDQHGLLETKPGSAGHILNSLNPGEWTQMMQELKKQSAADPSLPTIVLENKMGPVPCVTFAPGPKDDVGDMVNKNRTVPLCGGAAAKFDKPAT